MPLSCKSGYRVGPGGKKITYHCLPSDAVRLKVPLSNTCSFNLSFQISDILDTTYTSGVACENSTRPYISR